MDTTAKPEPQDSLVLPFNEYDFSTVQLLRHPHQPEVWQGLVNIVEAIGDISKMSAFCDALLNQYPKIVCNGLDSLPHFFPLSTQLRRITSGW